MNAISYIRVKVFLIGVLIVAVSAPSVIHAQTGAATTNLPPISQQMVREGDYAVQLHAALGLGTADDESAAESNLGKVGVIPRNGWIADYPVTPDIIGELRIAVGDAADAHKIALGKDEALKRMEAISGDLGLAINPYTSTGAAPVPTDASVADQYPDPTEVNQYYLDEGPPIVTYYSPPADYYYLYGWVPYPFWCSGFWFPGFFILHDFHRSFRSNGRVFFVSNHFNDLRSHHVFRVDPVSRFNGRTFAGIGVSNRRGFISTGVPRSERAIFNAPRAQRSPGMRPISGTRPAYTPSAPARSVAPSVRSGRTFSAPATSGATRSFSAPNRGSSGRTYSAPAAPSRSFSAPSGTGGRSSGAPSGGHGGGMGGSRGR
jgi:hypothetical protein